jgi:hypothetical protein
MSLETNLSMPPFAKLLLRKKVICLHGGRDIVWHVKVGKPRLKAKRCQPAGRRSTRAIRSAGSREVTG